MMTQNFLQNATNEEITVLDTKRLLIVDNIFFIRPKFSSKCHYKNFFNKFTAEVIFREFQTQKDYRR